MTGRQEGNTGDYALERYKGGGGRPLSETATAFLKFKDKFYEIVKSTL